MDDKIQLMKKNFSKALERGIRAHSMKETQETLGDRSQYVGGSDLGKCIRNVFLSKTQPVEHSIEKLIVFRRGHIAETIIGESFEANGFNFEEQREVLGFGDNAGIRSHIDFLLDFGKESVVVECKSVSNEIVEPYESWKYQVTLAMGLLRLEGKVHCDRAFIVCIDVNKGWHQVFPILFSEQMFQLALANAKEILHYLKTKELPNVCKISPICGYCPYSSNCPAITSGVTEVEGDLKQNMLALITASKESKRYGDLKKSVSSELIPFFETTQIKNVKVEQHTIAIRKKKGSVTINTELLRAKYPQIFEECSSEGKDSVYLQVL